MRLCFFVALFAFCLPVGGLAQNEDLTVRIIGDKACNDGVDNDGDDKIDFGSDPGCESGNDADEYNLSGGGGGYNPQTVTIVSDMSGLFGQKKDEEKEEVPVNIPNSVIISGYAYPNSTTHLLQDGSMVLSAPSEEDGRFEMRLLSLEPRVHVFGISAVDANGERSILQTFSVNVEDKVTTVIDGIFLPPTIYADKLEVKKGGNINFFGSSVPNAKIALTLNLSILERESIVGVDGKWSISLNTSSVDYGNHIARAFLPKSLAKQRYSSTVSFLVSDKNIFASLEDNVTKKIDINGDGRVNLADFSVAAFWYQKPDPEKGDLNGDRIVDLVDMSILAYYWTG